MLLIQRAVLDKLSPLIPRATIRFTTSIKKLNNQSRKIPKRTATQQNIFKRAHRFENYAQQRSKLRPLLSRPQYDIDFNHQKEQQRYKPISKELLLVEDDAKLPKLQFPPLVQRPQFDIDDKFQEEHQESLSEEFTSTQQEFLRPQLNLQSDLQYQPVKNEREFKPNYQQGYTLPENQKHQSPSYNQYDLQKQLQHSPQYEQNNEQTPEKQYSLIREKYNPQIIQVFGSPTGEQHNPLREQQYHPPLKQQEHESLVRLSSQEQYEPQPVQQYGPPSEVKYKPLSEFQNNPSTKYQYQPPIRVQQDLTGTQEHVPVYVPSQSGQYNAVLGHHLQNKQNEPLDNRHISLPLIEISAHSLEKDTMENKPIKPKFQQPELLYDFSREQHFGAPGLTPNQSQKSAQLPMSLKKTSNQFLNPQPNSQPYMSQLESPYQKLLAQNNTTTLSDDDSFSFDEIFAQLQDPPSESQITARPDQTPEKKPNERGLQDRTFDEPYTENDRQHDMYIPRVESPL